MCIEGVLLVPKPDYAASLPIDAGRRLLDTLSEHHTAPVTLISSHPDEKFVRTWLQTNRIRWSNLVVPPDPVRDRETYFAQTAIEYRVRQGGFVDWFVTGHPRTASLARSRGLTTLLFIHPQYSVPELREPPPVRKTPWKHLAEAAGPGPALS